MEYTASREFEQYGAIISMSQLIGPIRIDIRLNLTSARIALDYTLWPLFIAPTLYT